MTRHFAALLMLVSLTPADALAATFTTGNVLSFNAVSNGPVGMSLTDQAGASGFGVARWNNMNASGGNPFAGTITAGNVLDAFNTGVAAATTVNYGFSGALSNDNAGTNSERMFRNEWDPFGAAGADVAISVANIPFDRYIVLSYHHSGNNVIDRGGEVTVNGETKSLKMFNFDADNPNGSYGYVEADFAGAYNGGLTPRGTFIQFDTYKSGDLTFALEATGNARFRFSGFQIVEIFAVPEPSTALLLGVGLIGLVSRRRRGLQGKYQATLLALLATCFIASSAKAAFLTPINATTNAGVQGNALIADTINHNGLVTAGTHTNAFGPNNFWRTTSAANTITVTYDLGAQFNLDSMQVWNYNESGTGGGGAPNTDRGLNNMTVSYSKDNVKFFKAENVSLAQASGVSTYAGEVKNFGDINTGVRYVKFDVVDTHGSNNGFSGLSEVRFNTTNAEIVPASVSVNQTANGGASFGIANLTNDNGMTGFGNEQSVQADGGNGFAGQWRQSTGGGNVLSNSEITFDLGSNQAVGAVKIWNFHESGQNDRGIDDFAIFQSDDDITYSLVGNFSLTQQAGSPSVLHDVIDLNDLDVNARYLRFDLATNFGDTGFYGLGEVRFFAAAATIPEPGTMALLGMGLVGLVSRRRRSNGKLNATRGATRLSAALLACGLMLFSQTEAFATPYNDVVLADNPIAYFQLNEASGSTAADSSTAGANHPSTLNGSFTLSQTPGRLGLGKSVNFTPNTSLRIPDHADFDWGTGNMSLELWYQTDTNSRGDLFTYKGGGGDFGIHSAGQGADSVSFYLNGYNGLATGVAQGDWHHLVVTRDTGTVSIYVDNVLKSTTTDTDTMTINNDLIIGANHTGDPGTLSLGFDGRIDEVAFYNRALLASEISEHFFSANVLPEPSTLVLLGLGLIGIAGRRSRSRRATGGSRL